MNTLPCFEVYDVRRRVENEDNEGLVHPLGRAVAAALEARLVVPGPGARAALPRPLDALADGLRSAACDALGLGLCGTEDAHFSTDHFGACVGVMVAACNKPIACNGFKLVGRGAGPLSDATFRASEADTATGCPDLPRGRGERRDAIC